MDTSKRPTASQFHEHEVRQGHKLENPLRDVILGGQDGLVNALGIILGVFAATSDTKILIATVIAASIAESISMGAVAYTSALSQKDYYESERRKEEREIEEEPEMEIEEVRRIYEKKGLKGKVLEEVVSSIVSDKKIWVDTMMTEELRIEPVHMKVVIKSSIIVTIATAIGHVIPLFPFFFVIHLQGVIVSLILCGVVLFATGVYQAVSLVGSWWKSGLRMLLIGLGAAGIGYAVAKLFHTLS
jgi:vacuolar iron transporter family protein